VKREGVFNSKNGNNVRNHKNLQKKKKQEKKKKRNKQTNTQTPQTPPHPAGKPTVNWSTVRLIFGGGEHSIRKTEKCEAVAFTSRGRSEQKRSGLRDHMLLGILKGSARLGGKGCLIQGRTKRVGNFSNHILTWAGHIGAKL